MATHNLEFQQLKLVEELLLCLLEKAFSEGLGC